MRIAIISDLHLGFGRKTEREEESFENAKQAFEQALKEKIDLILIPGDIFDASIPSTESWHKAFELFSIPEKEKKAEILIETEKKKIHFSGIPIIAIHGTHEYRGKEYKNSLQVLESAGKIIYLHAQTTEVAKGKERIAVHGLGGIPEKKALEVFRLWNPKPLHGMKNFLVFHQSIKEFLPTEDEMSVTLSLEHLPKGFDFYIDGHLHWHSEKKLNEGLFLVSGSTIITQMKKLESEKPKGFTIIDTEKDDCTFIPIEKQRRLYYKKFSFHNASMEEVKNSVKEFIQESLKENNSELTPLIRIKLSGTLAKGLSQGDLDLREIDEEFSKKAILSIEKDFSLQEFKKKISELREMQKSKQSIATLGFQLLEKHLEATNFAKEIEMKKLFDLLAEDEIEKAEQFLLEAKAKKEIKENRPANLS